jgi:hypothetical protein
MRRMGSLRNSLLGGLTVLTALLAIERIYRRYLRDWAMPKARSSRSPATTATSSRPMARTGGRPRHGELRSRIDDGWQEVAQTAVDFVKRFV